MILYPFTWIQLTTQAVEKDPTRNRAPLFLCGSLTEEKESTLTVFTPLPNTPYAMTSGTRKPVTESVTKPNQNKKGTQNYRICCLWILIFLKTSISFDNIQDCLVPMN